MAGQCVVICSEYVKSILSYMETSVQWVRWCERVKMTEQCVVICSWLQLRAQLQLERGHACVLETKWRSSPVCCWRTFYGRCSDLQLIVYGKVLQAVVARSSAPLTSTCTQPGVRYPTRDSPDCIPIVGAAKSLVLNDKKFNHTKVWCTFIFIDLQAS